MAAINDLISQIQDETLRNRIQEEVSKMAKQKKFGLVFEEHMPESTPLYDMPIKRGCNVMRRDSKDDKSIYVVLRVEGDTAVCVKPEKLYEGTKSAYAQEGFDLFWGFVEDEIDEDGFNEYDDEETAEKKQAIQAELKIVRHILEMAKRILCHRYCQI